MHSCIVRGINAEILQILAHNRENNHNHVKDVPAIGEVVVAQCKELQQKLPGENYNKDKVDPVQHFLSLVGLIIGLHHHCDHVETDQHHDGDVKDLLRHKVKDHALDVVLRRQMRWQKEKKMLLYMCTCVCAMHYIVIYNPNVIYLPEAWVLVFGAFLTRVSS